MKTALPASGTIEGLYIKHKQGEAAVASAAMHCVAGLGIVGDVHANSLSPRQILVTCVAELARLRIPPGALQENLVILCRRPDVLRPGSALLSASGVEIRLTMFCEPCKRIAHIAPDLAKLVKRRGVLGTFVSGGELRQGDAIQLIPQRYDALPESPYLKFLDAVAAIPEGQVARYIDLTVARGVADGFVRALPAYIRRSLDRPLPWHRIVNARGQLLAFIPGQAGKLLAEGLDIRDNAVSLYAALVADSGRPQ